MILEINQQTQRKASQFHVVDAALLFKSRESFHGFWLHKLSVQCEAIRRVVRQIVYLLIKQVNVPLHTLELREQKPSQNAAHTLWESSSSTLIVFSGFQTQKLLCYFKVRTIWEDLYMTKVLLNLNTCTLTQIHFQENKTYFWLIFIHFHLPSKPLSQISNSMGIYLFIIK